MTEIITKKMINTVLDGKLTSYAHTRSIEKAVMDVNYDMSDDEDFQEALMFDEDWKSFQKSIALSRTEDKLREMGFRIWGDK